MDFFNSSDVLLESGWQALLGAEFNERYMQQLFNFLAHEEALHKTIYPPKQLIFNALNSTPYGKVKLVILGQDPYHGEGQAHGLSFSVPEGVKPPPSLMNIFKEQTLDLGVEQPAGFGCLQSWANQGVLLLNSVLTVEQAKPASHQGRGWEWFTDKIIQQLNQSSRPIVFLLWGAYAQKKGAYLDKAKHLILKAPHPSPLSAHRGFIGCQHFSKANKFLRENGRGEIDWQLSV